MHRFELSRRIAAPADEVWSLVDDFADTWVYHPIVERSESTNGQRRGLGARRVCHLYGGASVQEEITVYDARRRSYRLEVVDFGPMPLKTMVVDIDVSAEGPNESRLSYRGGFVVRFGPLGWLMGRFIMRRKFETTMGQLLAGVATHLSTGRVIERGGKTGPLRAALGAGAAAAALLLSLSFNAGCATPTRVSGALPLEPPVAQEATPESRPAPANPGGDR